MARTKHTSPLAIAYAASLLELANERKEAEQIAQELAALRQILQDNPSFHLYLADPAIGNTEREEMIKRIFASKFSQLTMNFLGVLNQKNRLGMLSEMADAYDNLLRTQQGKIEVDVTVAQKLSPQQLDEVRKKVSD